MLMFAFIAGSARAANEYACQLSVSSSPVAVNQAFSYTVYIGPLIYPGPLPPGGNNMSPFTVVFHGTKDGVEDIHAPNYEPYPGYYGYGYSTLGGYYNPGGYAGTYTRWVHVYDKFGNEHCTTYPVTVVLQ